MEPSASISAPGQPGFYPGRQEDCVAALRPAVAGLAEQSKQDIVAAFNGGFTESLDTLAHRAEAAGWSYDEAKRGIERLVREYEGAQAAIFD
jgi:hypothetical protein